MNVPTSAPAWAVLKTAALTKASVLLVGRPGSGKLALARAALDLLPHHGPFRAPHHTCSEVALLGPSASRQLRMFDLPGELQLAHRGILLLHDLPEFRASILAAARGWRASGFLQHHDVWLIGTMVPCPCGLHRDGCRCSASALERHEDRVRDICCLTTHLFADGAVTA